MIKPRGQPKTVWQDYVEEKGWTCNGIPRKNVPPLAET